jgi:hypothetical protein
VLVTLSFSPLPALLARAPRAAATMATMVGVPATVFDAWVHSRDRGSRVGASPPRWSLTAGLSRKRSGLCWAGPIGWAKQEKQAGEGQQGGEARAVGPAGP